MAVVRAILRDAPVLPLDEAETPRLDPWRDQTSYGVAPTLLNRATIRPA